jgi:hypothetical protein
MEENKNNFFLFHYFPYKIYCNSHLENLLSFYRYVLAAPTTQLLGYSRLKHLEFCEYLDQDTSLKEKRVICTK